MSGSLEGIVVLDLTRVVAGPACTRTLADYGASVIKIEPPDGDLMRRGVPKANGVSLMFAQQNAGKELLSIDLTQPAGQDIVLQLAAKADILVENYRPGVADRLGLGYEAVRDINPTIVYCSISGYGQSNASANRRAYAPVIHAELGLLDLNARERNTEPMPESVSHVDFAVASQAAAAILAALVHRERNGTGQHVDVSMAETMLATNEYTSVEVNGGFGDEISPFRPGKAAVLRLNDGTWVQLPGNPTTSVFRVASALGKVAELEARGWHSFEDTQGAEAEVRELLMSWASEFDTVPQFEAALDSVRIPLGTVKSVAGVIEEEWAQQRGAFVKLDVNGESRWVPRSPARFSDTEAGPAQGAYLRGAHNRSSLKKWLDLADDEIDALEHAGVLDSEDG